MWFVRYSNSYSHNVRKILLSRRMFGPTNFERCNVKYLQKVHLQTYLIMQPLCRVGGFGLRVVPRAPQHMYVIYLLAGAGRGIHRICPGSEGAGISKKPRWSRGEAEAEPRFLGNPSSRGSRDIFGVSPDPAPASRQITYLSTRRVICNSLSTQPHQITFYCCESLV
jgi:hypothetical protein